MADLGTAGFTVISPDEAAKLIMSAGLIQPEGPAPLAAAMAAAARLDRARAPAG